MTPDKNLLLARRIEKMADDLIAANVKQSTKRDHAPKRKRAYLTKEKIKLSAAACRMVEKDHLYACVIRDEDDIILSFRDVFAEFTVAFRKDANGGLICSDRSMALLLPEDFDGKARQYDVIPEDLNRVRLTPVSKEDRDNEKREENGQVMLCGKYLFIPDELIDKVDGIGAIAAEILLTSEGSLGVRFCDSNDCSFDVEDTRDGVYINIGEMIQKRNGEMLNVVVRDNVLVIEK